MFVRIAATAAAIASTRKWPLFPIQQLQSHASETVMDQVIADAAVKQHPGSRAGALSASQFVHDFGYTAPHLAQCQAIRTDTATGIELSRFARQGSFSNSSRLVPPKQRTQR